jgi:RimJ/RimL family protein N-acetyltransferase
VNFDRLVLSFDGGVAQPLRVEDIHPGYVAGLNDPAVNRYLVTVRGCTQTTDTVTEFVRKNLESDAAILLGVWESGVEKHCGTIRLHQIENHSRTACIGVCLFDKRVWGRGLATGALRAVTAWAFEVLKLRWIEAGMYVENHSSERAFRAAGYEWAYDVADKYLLNGRPAAAKFYAARNPLFFPKAGGSA